MWKRENAQLTRSVISGFGRCSQRAGAEKGVDSVLHPACQVAKPVRVCPACKVADSYDSALLASSKYGWQCTACQVVKLWFGRTLTPKTVNVFLAA